MIVQETGKIGNDLYVIGSVSHLKEVWPDLKIVGSVRCGEILQKPKAVQLMRDLNFEGAKDIKKMGGCAHQ